MKGCSKLYSKSDDGWWDILHTCQKCLMAALEGTVGIKSIRFVFWALFFVSSLVSNLFWWQSIQRSLIYFYKWQTNQSNQESEHVHFCFLFHYREQTWQWLLSPSPTCVKRSSTSPSLSWAWASASCIANPMPLKMVSSPSWTLWLLTSGSTSSWPTWVLVVFFLSLPGKSTNYFTFVLSVLYTFSRSPINRQ